MQGRYLIFGVGVGFFFIDQVSKYLAEQFLSPFFPIAIFPQVFYLQLAHNYGAAYSLFQYQRFFLVGVGIIAIILGGFYAYFSRLNTRRICWAMAFFLSGSLGNLVDRIVRGFVVDFVDIRIFPVFNVADVLINVGILLLIWDLFTRDEPSPTL